MTCNDHDQCTTDSCAQSAGCQFIAIPGCADTDHDGKLDPDDECTTIDWTSPPTSPPDQFPKAFGLIATKLARPDGEQGMLVKGAFNVAASSVLPVNPATNGIHLYAADAIGTVFDVSLPGGPGCDPGDGWTTGGPPTRTIWKYRNRSGALPPACTPGSAQGLSSVQIKDSRLANKQALQFKAKAKPTTLLRDPDVPLTRVQVSFALGGAAGTRRREPPGPQRSVRRGRVHGNPIPTHRSRPARPSSRTARSTA